MFQGGPASAPAAKHYVRAQRNDKGIQDHDRPRDLLHTIPYLQAHRLPDLHRRCPTPPTLKMNKEDFEESIILSRFAKRLCYGAVIGWLAGMFISPPFKGITTTSSDVQGLVYFSWLMSSGVGMVLGAFAGLISRRNSTGAQKTAKGSSNQAL